ncbi:MAG TPA: hypothetical protein VMW17_03120 [Candidatus Binatia bacterium]|nr:hypothetical protein [Candidatus Binatia bacterium]
MDSRTEIYRSAAVVVWWRDDEILHIQATEGHDASAAEATDMVRALRSFLGGKRALTLIDRRQSYSPSFAALRVIGDAISELFSAIAYYAPTKAAQVASRTVIDTFFGGQVEHIGIFETEAEAVGWLRSLNRA